MSEPRWLTIEVVRALHDESIALFGGAPGLRDEGLLDSALARPRNLHAYEETSDVARLAAAYCSGIVRNHPFIDGNKRAGLLAAAVFIQLNGMLFEPDEAEEVAVILDLASGQLTDDQLAAWFSNNTSPVRRGSLAD